MIKNMMILITSIFTILGLFSCSNEPVPIQYGKDECVLCRMLIVEKPYGAELLNTKGKAFKFDSDECLIRFIRKGLMDEKDMGQKYVVDFSKPGTLISAEEAFFLQSYKLQSPMGAGLTSFGTELARDKAQKKFGGQKWTWGEAFKNLP